VKSRLLLRDDNKEPSVLVQALLVDGCVTDGDISRQRFDRDTLSNDFCVSSMSFLNFIAFSSLLSHRRHIR
jgi:hypothetical protein